MALCAAVRQVGELDAVFNEESQQRSLEVQQINEVMRSFELLLESRDLASQQRHSAQVESKVRQISFRIQKMALATAMDAWKIATAKSRRLRGLANRTVAHWRKKQLVRTFVPWARQVAWERNQRIGNDLKDAQKQLPGLYEELEKANLRIDDTVDSDMLSDGLNELDDKHGEIVGGIEDNVRELRPPGLSAVCLTVS